jgi:hypothetical protein
MHNNESFDASGLSPERLVNKFSPYQMTEMMRFSTEEELHYKPIPLLQRLFPIEFEKIARSNQEQIASNRYEFRREILTAIGNMICEDLKEQCFHYIQRSKIKLDSETKLFIGEQIIEYNLKISNITFEYLIALEQQLLRLQELREIESKRLMEQQIHENKFLVLERLKDLTKLFANSLFAKNNRSLGGN